METMIFTSVKKEKKNEGMSKLEIVIISGVITVFAIITIVVAF